MQFVVNTVKLRYNGLAYHISSVMVYASSRSLHFFIQNVLVSTYLDIMYLGYYEPIFGPKPDDGPRLVRTFARRHAILAVDFSQ